MNLLRTILLVFAVLMLAKGLWFLFAPSNARRVANWWLEIPEATARQVGIASLLAGLILVGLGAWYTGQAVVAAVIVLGALLIVAGLLYQKPQLLRSLFAPFTGLHASRWFRPLGILLIAVAVFLLVIWYRQRP